MHRGSPVGETENHLRSLLGGCTMQKLTFVLLVCLAVVGAGAALANTSHHHTGWMSVKGDISKLDATAKTIGVTGEKKGSKEVLFNVDDKTKIVQSSKTLSFGDLKNDEDVTVYYVVKDGKNVATEIKVAGGEPKPASH
jgi:hypothetical protein